MCAPRLTLLDGTEVVRQDNRGFKRRGYNGVQTLFRFDGSGYYTLRIKPSGSGDMRLSFTFAENYFEVAPFISTYEDISHMDDGCLFCDWVPGMYAVVGRYTPTESGEYTVTIHGCQAMESYIIDPGSTELFAGYSFAGEMIDDSVYLTSGKTYYVVMFIPDGILDVPPCMLYFTIG